MPLKVIQGWNYPEECIALFCKRANEENDAEYVASFSEKYGVPPAQVALLLKEIEQVSAHVLERVQITQEQLTRYFGYLHEESICIAALLFLPAKGQPIDAQMSRILTHTPQERLYFLAQAVLGCLEVQVVPEARLLAVASVDELLRRILRSDLSQEKQMLLIGMCVDTDAYVREAGDLLIRAEAAFKEKEALLAPLLQETTATLRERIEQRGEGLAELFGGRLHSEDAQDKIVEVYPSAIYFNHTRFDFSYGGHDQVLVGVLVERLRALSADRASEDEQAAQILQLLGDKTKQEILRLLRGQKLYGQELAGQLSLSTATISYHMNLLIQQQLVMAQRESARIYYTLNPQGIERALDLICHYLKAGLGQ